MSAALGLVVATISHDSWAWPNLVPAPAPQPAPAAPLPVPKPTPAAPVVTTKPTPPAPVVTAKPTPPAPVVAARPTWPPPAGLGKPIPTHPAAAARLTPPPPVMATRPTPPPPAPVASPAQAAAPPPAPVVSAAPAAAPPAAKAEPVLPAVTAKPDLGLPTVAVKPNLAPSSSPVEAAPGAPAPRLRIKNASAIRVTLGATRRHEPASAIRPEKGIWNVVLSSELPGASAELVDLTPEAPRSRWSVEVQGDKIVLDAHRFLPTHVYQIDVRKDRSVVGTALLYLHQPPVEKRARLEFTDGEAKGKATEKAAKPVDESGIAPVPKGGL